jgi:hypothetical protein
VRIFIGVMQLAIAVLIPAITGWDPTLWPAVLLIAGSGVYCLLASVVPAIRWPRE